jgi:type II secretory pathway pseudopilin PulG
MSLSARRKSSVAGFSLIEVLAASVILGTAVLAVGLLIMKMTTGSIGSKDVSSAAVLLSEKLEDLNRWDSDDPQVCVPTGQTSVGSLTADISQTTTCPGGASTGVNYFDDVYPNLSNGAATCPSGSAGCFAETVSSSAGTSTLYTTTFHSPDGIVQSTTANSPPAGVTFHRRWVIEASAPAAGSRRVTVLVTKANTTPSVSLQMSIVRP